MNRISLSLSVRGISGSLINILYNEARSFVVARLWISIRSGSSRDKSFSSGTKMELVRTRDMIRWLRVSSVLVVRPS